jgi:hypothetical protein
MSETHRFLLAHVEKMVKEAQVIGENFEPLHCA